MWWTVLVCVALCRASIVASERRPTRAPRFFYNREYRSRDLWEAIRNDDETVFEEILECGCVNLEEPSDETGETPLLLAVSVGNLRMLRALVREGADVNAADANGFTPLHTAAFAHAFRMAELLLENGADVNARNVYNERPIINALVEDDPELVELLIRNGAEINFQDNEGETPLHEAAFYGSVESVQTLIDHGANTTIRDKNGQTAVDIVCLCAEADARRIVPCSAESCTRATRRAVERVFRQAEQNVRGDGPRAEELFVAVINGTRAEVARVLRSESMELQAITQSDTVDWVEGQTALHLAILANRTEICALLLKRGARPGVRNAEGNTPLHLAVEMHSGPLVELILDQDVRIDVQNEEDKTPLHVASENGFAEAAALLLDRGASVELHDDKGSTATEVFCNCRMRGTCVEGFCASAADVAQLMDVFDVRDEAVQLQYANLYFDATETVAVSSESGGSDDDDGASSLGLFVGLLFVCASVFFVIYGVAVLRIRRRRIARIMRQLSQPGPSSDGVKS